MCRLTHLHVSRRMYIAAVISGGGWSEHVHKSICDVCAIIEIKQNSLCYGLSSLAIIVTSTIPPFLCYYYPYFSNFISFHNSVVVLIDWTISSKTRDQLPNFHLVWVFYEDVSIVSSPIIYIVQMLSPIQPFFWKLSHVRIEFLDASHRNTIIIIGAFILHKVFVSSFLIPSKLTWCHCELFIVVPVPNGCISIICWCVLFIQYLCHCIPLCPYFQRTGNASFGLYLPLRWLSFTELSGCLAI